MYGRPTPFWPALAAAAVPLLYFMYVPGLLLVWTALATVLVVGGLAHLRPAWRLPLLRACGVTGLALLAQRIGVTVNWGLHSVLFNPWPLYWTVNGPGGGLLSLLPGVGLVLLCGAWIYELPLAEQWGGQLHFTRQAWGYGLAVGVGAALLTAAAALTLGHAHLAWQWSWPAVAVNLVTNLYEEILARGLLLQIVRRGFGARTAVIWSSLFFGLIMHGPNLRGLLIALIAPAWGWAVLKSRTLWTGWVAHMVVDLILDTLVH